MTPSTRKGIFRFHLATAIVGCVAAAIFGTLLARSPDLRRILGGEHDSGNGGGLIVVGGNVATINPPNRQDPVEHTFALKNPTNVPIKIDAVACSCSCVSSKLNTYLVEPGQQVDVTLSVLVGAYKPDYREVVQVETSAGDLELIITGRLPLPQEPLYRPTDVYINPLPGLPTIEREVFLRVPKHCSRELKREDISWTGASFVEIDLTELSATDLYREYRLRLTLPSNRSKEAKGRLALDSGCGGIVVTVHPEP